MSLKRYDSEPLHDSLWNCEKYPQKSSGISLLLEDAILPSTDEQGFYKYRFNIIAPWKNKKVVIVFEASMTDTEVKINSKSAGAIHQGGFYEFKYDITKLLKPADENLLEVTSYRKHKAEGSGVL